MNMRLTQTCVTLFVLAGSLALLSQMPDWKFFRDREGNTYFIDQAGKIRIIDAREYRFLPVTPRGIDYYLHYGAALIQEHRVTEGLSVLKSIRALPADNNRIYQAQVKATELMDALKKKNGPRFTTMNESASLIIFQTNTGIAIINDMMFYSFQVPGRVTEIRKRDRAGLDYRYEGVLFGVKTSSTAGNNENAYDILFAVDSEKFAVKFNNCTEAAENWKGALGYDGLVREPLVQGDDRLVYAFRSNGTPNYSGIEGVFVNGTFSHYARLISSNEGYRSNGHVMRKIMDSFRVVAKTE